MGAVRINSAATAPLGSLNIGTLRYGTMRSVRIHPSDIAERLRSCGMFNDLRLFLSVMHVIHGRFHRKRLSGPTCS